MNIVVDWNVKPIFAPGEVINEQETPIYIFNLFDISFYILYTDKTNNKATDIPLANKNSLKNPYLDKIYPKSSDQGVEIVKLPRDK